MDPLQILGRLGTENPPTDAELAAAETALLEALDAATKAAATAEDVALAKDLRSALDAVRSESTTRQEAAEARAAEAKALREGLFEDDAPADDAPTAEDDAPAEEPKPEPVAASPADLLNRITANAKRLPAPEVKEPKAPSVAIRPIGVAAGFELKQDAGFADLGQLFSTHAKSITSSGASQPLFRLERRYDEERTLGSNVNLNNQRLADAFGTGMQTQQALSAAGGLCGPGDVDHSHPICSDRGRPVKDSMLQFNASRGRLQFAPSASLGDMDPNISIWTSEMDAAAVTGGMTKPCPRIECPEELSESVDAVVKCITVGNFQAQFSPEFWASRLELALAAHDRVAERKAISEIHDASQLLGAIAPSGGNTLDTFLTTVNSVIETDRLAHRNLSGRYVVLTDSYVRTAIRNQFIRNLGVANNVEALQIADSEINGWLGDVNATGIWTPDGTIDLGTGENREVTPGAIPDSATVYIYPVEAFLFLDGGTLDLGTSITDSSLNAVNDRQAFAETFEKVAFRGCSAYAVEIGLESACGCPA
jgi:hypothetical protein